MRRADVIEDVGRTGLFAQGGLVRRDRLAQLALALQEVAVIVLDGGGLRRAVQSLEEVLRRLGGLVRGRVGVAQV